MNKKNKEKNKFLKLKEMIDFLKKYNIVFF